MVRSRRPGASAPTTDCESGGAVRKGGYRIWLIAPVTSDSDMHESQELGRVLQTGSFKYPTRIHSRLRG
eukprot:982828-Prorocentrum_minimum.AAC.1